MLVQPSCCIQLVHLSRAAPHPSWNSLYMSVGESNKNHCSFAPPDLLSSTSFLRHLSEEYMKYGVWKYQITVCLAYIIQGRKRKPKQDGFTLLSMLNHSSTQQTYVQVEKCQAEEIQKFSRRPGRHLSIRKHQQLYLMIHKASKHLRNKRWKPIPGRQDEQGFGHVHTCAGP